MQSTSKPERKNCKDTHFPVFLNSTVVRLEAGQASPCLSLFTREYLCKDEPLPVYRWLVQLPVQSVQHFFLLNQYPELHCLLHPHSATEAGERYAEAGFGFATIYVPAPVWHAESHTEALSVRAAAWSREEDTALCKHPHCRWPHLGKSASFPILSKGEN